MAQSTQPDGATAAQTNSGQSRGQSEQVTLPSNVSIYSGKSGQQLLNAKLLTRLETTVQDPKKLAAALGSDCASFCFQHHNVAVIFDDDDQDLHHEHFRQVCLKLKEHDLGLQYGSCVFDASSILQAGFQLDKLAGSAILVIDLQNQEEDDDDDDDDDDSEDVDFAALGMFGGDAPLDGAQGDEK